MHSDCCPQSTDRVLQVSGEIENVIDCLRQVIEHLETLDPPSDQMRYDPNNYNDDMRYGGIRSDGSEQSRGGGRQNNQGGGGGGGVGHMGGQDAPRSGQKRAMPMYHMPPTANVYSAL